MINNIATIQPLNRQKGFVLMVSMMLLVVITMIGVTAISNSTLEGKMAHNMQHAMYAFHAAETVVENTIRASNPKEPDYDATGANDPTLIADGLGGGLLALNPDMTEYQSAIGAGVVISTAGSTISRLGAGTLCPGESTLKCVPFQINAVVTINSSNTISNHVQWVVRKIPYIAGS